MPGGHGSSLADPGESMTREPTETSLAPRVVVDGGVPIHLYVDERIEPDQRAVDQLGTLSRVPGVAGPVVALPDIHYKGRNPSPTGTVVAVEAAVVPKALDAGLNCGMRVHLLDLTRDEVGRDGLERLFARIRELVPTGWHDEPTLGDDDLDAVLAVGASWVIERHDGRGGPVTRIENRGRLATVEPRRVVNGLLRRRARRGLGVLGGGNHFLEVHVVEEALDERAAALGLREGRLLVMLHSGSGVVGKTLGLYFGPRNETVGRRHGQFLAEKAAYHVRARGLSRDLLPYARRDGFTVLSTDAPEGRRFLAAQAAAANFGYANRAALGGNVEQAVADVFGAGASLLTDVSHNLVQRERHDGREVFVHRQGASRALDAAYVDPEGPFEATGQPFPVPGSMGAAAYICLAGPDAGAAFRSANHGAGRLLDKPEARGAFTEGGVRDELSAQSILLFKEGKGLLEEQAPGAFKDVTAVIDVMTRTGIALPAARTQPLAVLKG